MCQYWLNDSAGRLTNPYFGDKLYQSQAYYGHNINCTWIINFRKGFYINFEILVN